MKRHWTRTVLILPALWTACSPTPPPPEQTVTAETGPFEVWSVYEGQLNARRVDVIMSRLSGSATISMLAGEGTLVQKGDALVEFDDSELKADLVRLERDLALAKTDLESLEKAKNPLELRELELSLLEAKSNRDAEQQFLSDSIELLKSDLVSPQEIEQQRLKVAQLSSRVTAIEEQVQLTRAYLHPAALAQAKASLSAAESALAIALEQQSNSVLRAPSTGIVVYRPLHVNSEYRTVRVGDTIFKNQPFMAVADLSEILVECQIPEGELGQVAVGKPAEVTPVAYPGLSLQGTVESVGAMATAQPGRPSWQKYFSIRIALSTTHPLLRSDMSVICRIRSYRKENSLSIPRAAVHWDDQSPYVWVRGNPGWTKLPVTLGQAGRDRVEVLEGLQAGATLKR